MGSLIGGAIGLAGSLFGGSKKKDAASTAAQQSLEGYNYLTKGAGAPAATSYVDAGTAGSDQFAANTAGNQGNYEQYNSNAAGANDALAQLTGVAPVQQGTKNAFQNYLNSTGYQFQMDQGSKAITGNNASKGILNSGATAKRLTQYGQDLASTGFNNYLNQVAGVQTNSANNAQIQQSNLGAQAGRGQTTQGQIAQAGTSGGAAASAATQNGGNAMGDAIQTGAGILGKAVASSNFFG